MTWLRSLLRLLSDSARDLTSIVEEGGFIGADGAVASDTHRRPRISTDISSAFGSFDDGDGNDPSVGSSWADHRKREAEKQAAAAQVLQLTTFQTILLFVTNLCFAGYFCTLNVNIQEDTRHNFLN